MKLDFSEYARSMRISTYGRTDSEVAQQFGWSTILEIGSDCLPPEIESLNLYSFSSTSENMYLTRRYHESKLLLYSSISPHNDNVT